MSALTPGPWSVDWYEDFDEDGEPVTPTHATAIRTDGGYAVCGTCDGCYKIESANARLIAAAPELLAACEAAHQHLALIYGSNGDWLVEAIAAAIAKARGT